MSRHTFLAAAIVLVAAAAVVGAWLAAQRSAPPQPEIARLLTTPRPVPQVPAVDHEGQAFTTTDLAGRWTVAFFGFTYCPDVCPATLQVLAQARRLLQDLPAENQPAVVMYSLDPERDTPERLAEYVPFFDAEFRGLHVAARDLPELTRGFGVAYAYAPLGEDNYTVDHTASLFVVDGSAELVAVFPNPPTAEQLANDFRRIIQLENAR